MDLLKCWKILKLNLFDLVCSNLWINKVFDKKRKNLNHNFT